MNNHQWQFFLDSESAWGAIHAALRNAKDTIDIEEFILANDDIGKPILETLKQKAAEGVKVRLMIDWVGSGYTYLPSDTAELRAAGIELVVFNPPMPWNRRHKTFSYYRDHNKNIIIDSHTGFTGGICISRDMRGWRDTTVRVTGPVAKQMREAFECIWRHASRSLLKQIPYQPQQARDGFSFTLNIPRRNKRFLYEQLIASITTAQKEILITNPYFAPTDKIFRLLVAKARNKITVRIVTPRNPDSKMLKYVAQSYISRALKAGVDVYYYDKTVNHAKVVVIDGRQSFVGSLNFDYLSLMRNFEGDIISQEPSFADELRQHFVNDTTQSTRLTLANWRARPLRERVLAWLIWPLRRWL